MAIEAAFEAERMHRERQEDQQRILDMELQQARYEASLPNAATLPAIPTIVSSPRSWRRTGRLRSPRPGSGERASPPKAPSTSKVDPSAFTNLADNLSAAWNAPRCHDAGPPATATHVDRRHRRRCR
jgi:hypothetical protein